MKKNTSLDQYGWQAFMWAEAQEPHRPRPMFSAQSLAAPFMWACGCGRHAYTYLRSDDTPFCSGGYEFSFSTTAL